MTNNYCCDPCCGGGGSGNWPSSGRQCKCCGGAGPCWPFEGTGDETWTETITQPCCVNGNCSACGTISCDAPWLQPKAIGCGRTHKCNAKWNFPLYDDELDVHDLPGRPPHTIVCVRAKGKTTSTIYDDLMLCGAGVDGVAGNSYDLYLCVTIPVEIIVRDCTGFLCCLHSKMSQIVRIPLATRVCNLKDTQIYLKARVRLCKTTNVSYPNTSIGGGINNPPTGFLDPNDIDCSDTDDFIAQNLNCNLGILGTEDDAFGMYIDSEGRQVDRALPEVSLDILIEACVMRLVPFGIIGDPNATNDQSTATSYKM